MDDHAFAYLLMGLIAFNGLAVGGAVWAQSYRKKHSIKVLREFAAAHGLEFTEPVDAGYFWRIWAGKLRRGKLKLRSMFSPPDLVRDRSPGDHGLVAGLWQGFPFALRIAYVPRGRGSYPCTCFYLDLPGLPAGLELAPEQWWSRFDIPLGASAQDIPTGDAAFDKAFIVKGQDEAAVRAYLTPERRRLLLEALAKKPELTLHETGLVWLLDGIVDYRPGLEKRLAELGQLGQRLAGS